MRWRSLYSQNQGRSSLVGGAPHPLEWEDHCPTQTDNITIETGASLSGWGAVREETRTGGPWSETERAWHINCLKLWAATLAVRCLVMDAKNCTILLRMDNTMAVAYVNNLGGTVSKHLASLARDLWMWCLQRDIHLVAQHLPGRLNITAEEESRAQFDRTDWMLNPRIFTKLNKEKGPLQVDLFASCLTAQLLVFYSRRLDPLAQGMDAFLQDWSRVQGYATPPWCLIGRVLSQVQLQGAELLLIAPVWKAQMWYPSLLGLLVDYPLLIPKSSSQIVQVHENGIPDTNPQLAAWHISGSSMQQQKFRQRLRSSC